MFATHISSPCMQQHKHTGTDCSVWHREQGERGLWSGCEAGSRVCDRGWRGTATCPGQWHPGVDLVPLHPQGRWTPKSHLQSLSQCSCALGYCPIFNYRSIPQLQQHLPAQTSHDSRQWPLRAATTACALSLLHPVFLILNFDPQQYSSARTHVSFRPHPPTPGQPGMWRSFTPVAVTSCHIGAVHCCPTKPCSSLCCETLCFFVLMFSFEILRRIDLSYPFHILFASCLVVKPRAASKTSWT